MRSIWILICAARLAMGADAPTHIRNFAAVNPHLYRGGEPSSEGLGELVALRIRTIIDLREVGETNVEEQKASALGIHYVNVPLARLSAPSVSQVERVLTLLSQSESEAVFLHCWRGKDRTGTVIACYRVQHDGWTNRQALEEAKRFGLSRLEPSMRSFIARFQPLNLPTVAQLGN